MPADVSPPRQPDGEDSQVAAAAFLQAVSEKGMNHFEWLQQRKDGSTFPADVLLSAFELEGKQVFLSSIRDISERRKLEDELQLLKISVDRSSDEVFWMDFNGSILYVNDAACRVTGYSRDELCSMKLIELDPDFPPEVWGESVADLRQRKTQFITTRHRCKNGTIIDVEIVTVYVNKDNREYSFAFVRDITERKRTEQVLAESEEKYRRIFDTFVDIYYETDINGIIQVLSPSVSAIGGWDPEELIGKPVVDLYCSPPDRQELLEKLKTNPIVLGFETSLKKRDGSATPASVNARVRFGQDGIPIGVVGSIRDITDAVKIRKALQASEEMYRRILENMQDAYLQVDPDGNITMANPSAARICGYDTSDQMIGIPIASHYLNPDKRQEMIKKLEVSGKLSDVTEQWKRRDGTTFWASLNIQFIKGEDGSIIGTEGILRDITIRKSLEQAVQEANRKLNLLSGITRHDVANQLTVLQGYAQLAAIKSQDPVTSDFLSKIGATADTITKQIEFTRTYEDLGIKIPDWFRLDETVEKMGRPEVAFSNTCRPIEILADPMLERVFFNLFENAIRHGEHVTGIGVRCERAPDGLVVIIEDDGVGIAPELKEKIFEKGFGKNTGFGLFLAREILAITGIAIRETGYLGIGARFEITVPRDMWRIAAGQ
jgi:PAS domain S-box-containing protein